MHGSLADILGGHGKKSSEAATKNARSYEYICERGAVPSYRLTGFVPSVCVLMEEGNGRIHNQEVRFIMFDPNRFTVTKAKPLPVMLLLDVSGSMNENVSGDMNRTKIATLNQAVQTMLSAFANEAQMETEIQVSIITFGEELRRLFPLTAVRDVQFTPLSARGGTPLGGCLRMAKAIVEDKEEMPSRAYRPTIILVSDGRPGDNWQSALQEFVSSGRSQKCDRMAMAIGDDADREVLGQFVAGTTNPLFEATDAEDILNFFKMVTMSVTMRTRSQNPNMVPTLSGIMQKSATSESSSSAEGMTLPKQADDDYL